MKANITKRLVMSFLFVPLCVGCRLSGDEALDTPAGIAQMSSPANVVIKNNLSAEGADVGGTADQYQRGFAMPGDLDGDGYADLVVVNSLCVHVIYGSPTWPHIVQVEQEPTLIPSDPDLGETCGYGTSSDVLGGPIPQYFRPSVAAAGDVDRDGYSDFLVSYTVMANHSELTYLVYGGPKRLSGRQRIADLAPVFVGAGGRVNGIGDINGDGYADLAAANTDDDDPAGSTPTALVFFGSAKRFVGQVSVGQAGASVSVPDAAHYFTPVLRGVGDLNGDGYADFVVGAFANACMDSTGTTGTCETKVWMVPGGKDLAGSLQVSAVPLVEGIAESGFRAWDGTYSDTFVSPLGDLDGDGFDDLAFVTSSFTQNSVSRSTHILYGRSDLLAQTNQADATLSDFYALASADVDADGILDLVAGAPNAENGNGAVYVLPGTHNRLSGNIDLSQNTFRVASSCPASAVGENVGFWVAAGSDVDGDRLDDVLVGALITQNVDGPPGISADPATNTGHAYLLRGAAIKRSLPR